MNGGLNTLLILNMGNLRILVAIKTEFKEFCSFLDDWKEGKSEKRIINVHKYKISWVELAFAFMIQKFCGNQQQSLME